MSIGWQNEPGPRYLGINSAYVPLLPFPSGSCHPASALLSWDGPLVFQLAVLKARASSCVTVLFLQPLLRPPPRAALFSLVTEAPVQPVVADKRTGCVPPSLAENTFAARRILETNPTSLPRVLPALGPFLGLCM